MGVNYENSTSIRRCSLKRRFLRALERVRNRINDLHNKAVASWLVHTSHLVLLPTFETSSKMLTKSFLRSKTCRTMQCWCHHSIKCNLISQAQKFKDAIVRIVNEVYTSKTCGRCGTFNQSLTGAKIFTATLAD